MSSSQNCKIIKHVRLTAPENYFIMGKLCKSVKLTSNYLLEVVLSIRMTKYVFLKIPYHSIKLHWKTCDIHLKLSSKLSSSRYIISSTEKQLAERIYVCFFFVTFVCFFFKSEHISWYECCDEYIENLELVCLDFFPAINNKTALKYHLNKEIIFSVFVNLKDYSKKKKSFWVLSIFLAQSRVSQFLG